MEEKLLKCGHSPNARRMFNDGTSVPCCAICDCEEFAEEIPDLTGRKARCGCGREVDSSFDLAFFEYGGDIQSADQELVKQRNAILREDWSNHGEDAKEAKQALLKIINKKIRESSTKDRYYCGCRGWD